MSARALAETKRGWNWWKIGFFAAVIAFELTREIAVIEADQQAEPSALKSIVSFGDYVTARGSWLRTDGGEALMPVTVMIECRRDLGQCVEASTTAHEAYFFAPELDWFDAKFTPEGVTYVNDLPACTRYSVRIDTATKRAFATRERKAGVAGEGGEMCPKLEPRIDMELGNSRSRKADPNKHFVPLVQSISAVFRVFV